MEVESCDVMKDDNFLAGFQILLVDDDEISLRVIEKVLTSCKYEVVAVTRATDALNILHKRKRVFDLILTDVHMPIMDGFDLLAIIQKEFQIPVILLSADSDRDLMTRGLRFGAYAFCEKPVTKNYAQNIWQFVCMQHLHQKRLVEKETESPRGASLGKKGSGVLFSKFKKHETTGMRLKEKVNKHEEVEENDNEEVGDNAESDEEITTPKKSRMVWTPSLHQKFVGAIKQIGIKRAVPKKILEHMNIKGVDRTKIASHLQKYRNYLKGSKEPSQYGRKVWDRYPASYTSGLSQFSKQGGSSNSSLSQEKYGHPCHTVLNQRNIQNQRMSTKLNTSVSTMENLSFRENGVSHLPSLEDPVISYPSYDSSSYRSNYVGLQLCDKEGMIGLRQGGLGGGVNFNTLISNNLNGTTSRRMHGEICETLVNVPTDNQVTLVAPTTDLYVNPGFIQTATLVPVAEPQQQEGQQLEGMDLDCWFDSMMNNSNNELTCNISNVEYTQQEEELQGLIMDPQFDVGDYQFDDYQP